MWVRFKLKISSLKYDFKLNPIIQTHIIARNNTNLYSYMQIWYVSKNVLIVSIHKPNDLALFIK